MKEDPTPGTALTVPWVRFLALAVAAMVGWKLALSLVRLRTLGSVDSSQIMSGAVLLSTISLVVTNKRAKLVLVVGGLMLAAAGAGLRFP
jgi:hypothetical protein